MARILAIARRIIRQMLGDRRTLAMMFIVPAAVLLLLGYLLRTTTETVTMAVAAEESAQTVADRVAAAIESTGRVSVRRLPPATAVEAVRQGQMEGALILPADWNREGQIMAHLLLEGTSPGANQAITAAAGSSLALVSLAQAGTTPPLPADLDVDYVYAGPGFETIDRFAPALIGLFAFLFIFVLTTVSFVRERSGGTLERLMASPVRWREVVLGYVLGFGLFALAQSLLILIVAVFGLDIHYAGNLASILFLVLALTLVSVNLGIFLSAFSRNEFQAAQFTPLVSVPQALLGGILWPLESMPRWLQGVAHVLPLTYAVDALREVMIKGSGLLTTAVAVDWMVLLAFSVFFVVMAAYSLRQQVG